MMLYLANKNFRHVLFLTAEKVEIYEYSSAQQCVNSEHPGIIPDRHRNCYRYLDVAQKTQMSA